MPEMKAFNFKQWIDDHRDALKPPVGNKRVFPDTDFIVMVVGGPNSRTDYHYNESEEFFYQLEGDIVLKVMQGGQSVDVPIREGDIFLLPPSVPHSPQRGANTVGLVIEKQRAQDQKDGLLWFCQQCNQKLYEEYFHLENIETQMPPVFERFYGSVEHRTCGACGTVMERP